MRAFVKGFGCSSNIADTEVLAGCLVAAGHTLVASPGQAELVVYNTCAVKAPTEDRMIYLLKQVPRDRKVLVAGCLPLVNPERLKREVRFDGVIGPAWGEGIVEVVRRLSVGKRVEEWNDSVRLPGLGLPRKLANPCVSIVPICYGCLGACAYCCVRHARGQLRSYSLSEIVERVSADRAQGIKEFWLTSQDSASYGRDIGVSLSGLLRRVCGIAGDFLLRVGMMTPNRLLDIVDDVFDVFADGKLFKFLHVPVQSGDDEVLGRMNRHYSVEEFRGLVEGFRARFPRSTVATDVIVGFPGETTEAFTHTLDLIETTRPDIVNVSKFYGRPGTSALRLQPQIGIQEVKARSGRLARLVRRTALERNREWVGWRGRILVDEVGKTGSVVGRNSAYKPVVLKCSADQCRRLLGQYLDVKVTGASRSHLIGEIA
jgi:threonylcarbamoyladenosine tRNA methylthiotransferase CDKAL1